MSLMINSEISKQFLLEEDAIEGFKKAVANNQIRLAMQILVEIVDAFMEGFEVLMEEPEEEVAPEEVTQNKKQEINLPAEPEPKKDEKEPAKPIAKKETKTAE
jgi:hypothetical protein